jgi:hypothetical protein
MNANRRAMADAADRAEAVMSAAMRANTVMPQSYVSGLVYFPRKKSKRMLLIIIIDDVAYSFGFSGFK